MDSETIVKALFPKCSLGGDTPRGGDTMLCVIICFGARGLWDKTKVYSF